MEELALAHKIEICGGKVELKDDLDYSVHYNQHYNTQAGKQKLTFHEKYAAYYIGKKYPHRLKRTYSREQAM